MTFGQKMLVYDVIQSANHAVAAQYINSGGQELQLRITLNIVSDFECGID